MKPKGRWVCWTSSQSRIPSFPEKHRRSCCGMLYKSMNRLYPTVQFIPYKNVKIKQIKAYLASAFPNSSCSVSHPLMQKVPHNLTGVLRYLIYSCILSQHPEGNPETFDSANYQPYLSPFE